MAHSYLSKSGGGLDHERWIQLNRSIGADRWQLAYLLESVLPLTILTALALFAAGFVSHLRSLQSEDIRVKVSYWLIFAAIYLLGGLFYRLVDPFCPYHTPLEVIWSFYVTCYQLFKGGLPSDWTYRIFVHPMKEWGSKLRALQPQWNRETFNSSGGIRIQRTLTRSGDIAGHITLQVEPIKVGSE